MKEKDVEIIVDLYGQMIKGVAYNVLYDYHLSEDALQITLEKLFLKELHIDNLGSDKTKNLIYIVARNTAIDLYRKRKREEWTVWDDDYMIHNNSSFNITRSLFDKYGFGDTLGIAIDSLKAVEKELIVLHFFYKFSVKEIAIMYGIKPNSVHKRIRVIKAKMKVILAEEEEENEKKRR